MSGLELFALGMVAAWLAITTVAIVLIVRQMALLGIRIDRVEAAPVMDGLSAGSKMPKLVGSVAPPAPDDKTHVLILEAGCTPCRSLVEEFHEHGARLPITAVIGGLAEAADSMAELIEPGIHTVTGDDAAEVIRALDVQSSPFAFTFSGGRVADKAQVRGASHLSDFISGVSSPAASHHHPLPSLEVTHVAEH